MKFTLEEGHGGVPRGGGPVALASDPSIPWTYRMSLAYFCAHCGEVWGRVHRGPTWSAFTRPCFECAKDLDFNPIGGSFFQNFDFDDLSTAELLKRYPDLLSWEFSVHLAWAERQGLFPVPSNQLEIAL